MPLYQTPVVGGVISSGFGYRTHPVTGEKDSFHPGIDIAAPEGTPVLAAREGTIEAVNQDSGTGGKVVYVKHADGSQTRYMHMSKILIDKVGLKVYARTAIGLVGHTGRSTGDHLHFEIRNANGEPIDPGELYGMKATTFPAVTGTRVFNIPWVAVLVVMIGFLSLIRGAK